MADIILYLRSLREPVREKLLSLFLMMPEQLRDRCVVQGLKSGRVLVSPLDRTDFVYVLAEGRMQTANQDLSGNIYVAADFSAPVLFGEFELIAGCPFYRGTLIAKSECRLIAIDRDTYLSWVQNDGKVLFQRARAVTRRLLEQSGNERNFLFMDGTKRVMFLLCRHYERYAEGGAVHVCITRQEMADQISVSVKTVGRGLRRLSEQGFIRQEGRDIILKREEYEHLRKILERELLTVSYSEKNQIIS